MARHAQAVRFEPGEQARDFQAGIAATGSGDQDQPAEPQTTGTVSVRKTTRSDDNQQSLI